MLLTDYPSFSLFQASKDAARYPVAAKVAELLVQGLVSPVFFFSYIWLNYNIIVLEQFRRLVVWFHHVICKINCPLMQFC